MQTYNNEEEKVINLLENLKKKLQGQSHKRFTFLLVGRTGVGKSTTVNSLMGQEIAIVGDYEPTTMEVKDYDSEMNGIKFKVIDTPGLCDDLEEKGNDYKYLELIRAKVNQIDSMWFISKLDDTRVTTDEKRGIKLISEAFKPKIWEQAVIIFTFAGNVEASKYEFALEKRTELIRKEIAKYTGISIANNIPAVAVDNKSETTPDKEKWLGELYTQVYARMSTEGAIPFLMATVEQIKQPEKEKEVVKEFVYVQTPPEKEVVKEFVYVQTPPEKEVVKEFVYVQAPPEKEVVYVQTPPEKEVIQEVVYLQTHNPSITPTSSKRIELNDRQTAIVKKKTSHILEMTASGATAGAAIGGSIAGPFGAAVGGAVGGVIGFFGGLMGW